MLLVLVFVVYDTRRELTTHRRSPASASLALGLSFHRGGHSWRPFCRSEERLYEFVEEEWDREDSRVLYSACGLG